MSTDNFEAELDDVLENLRTDFIKKKKKKKSSSASSTFPKSHDIGAVSATLRTIMDRENPPPPIILPTTSSSNNKRSTNSAAETSTAKFQRLDDDDEAIDIYSQQSIEELKEELLEQYFINDQLPLEEDDGVEEETVDVADGEESDEEVQRVTICEPCPPVSKKHRSSDNDLKNFAFTRPQMNIARCSSSECRFGGNCVGTTTMDDMQAMVNDFWDDEECEAPSSATRRLKLLTILRNSYRSNEDDFQFFAGCKEKNNRRVCEAGFLILLGIINSPIASKAPGQWKRLKKYVASGKDVAGIEYKSVSEEKLMKAESKSNKMKSALTFIEYFAKEFGDTIPGAEGNNIYISLTYKHIILFLYKHTYIFNRWR